MDFQPGSKKATQLLCEASTDVATTLLRLIYGALLPSRGEVLVLGTPTSAWSHPHPAVKSRLYPRDWVLQWRLTIRQNLEFFGFMAQLSRKDTAYRIDALAETFGVKERLEQRLGCFQVASSNRSH